MKQNARKTVLIVDDDPLIRDLLRLNLEKTFQNEVDIHEAGSGPEAIEKVAEHHYDCIVTDLNMPNTEPRSLIRGLKEVEKSEGTPLIVLTGYPDESLLHEFDPLILVEKPVPMPEFMRVIQSQLRLGKLSERMATNFLNPFVSSITEFLSEGIGIKSDRKESSVQHPERELSGDFISIVSFGYGPSLGHFAIGFDENLLKHIREKELGNSRETLAEVAERFTYHIYDRICEIVMTHAQTRPLLKKVKTLVTREVDGRFLKGWRGLAIPIQTQYGTVYVQAVSPAHTIVRSAG